MAPSPGGRPPLERLFVGLWPNPEAVAHLAARLGTERPEDPALRWQPAERWHITVAFLGQADPGRARRRLDRLALPTPGPLRLAGSGRFGPILWVGVEQDGWLADLAETVQRTLRIADGPYRPHLTVARARGREGAAVARAAAPALAGYRGPGWTPEVLTLVRSRTGPHPSYEVIGTWPFPSA